MENTKFIYILSAKRGKKLPEIFSIWDTYELGLKAYYDYCVGNGSGDWEVDWMGFYEFPLNELYCELDSVSKIKMGKSCPYRKKFKSFIHLETEYKKSHREEIISELID